MSPHDSESRADRLRVEWLWEFHVVIQDGLGSLGVEGFQSSVLGVFQAI